jgi:hypothetical protein
MRSKTDITCQLPLSIPRQINVKDGRFHTISEQRINLEALIGMTVPP